MAHGTALRSDFSATELRRLSRRSKCAAQARRLLALAAIHDGGTRSEAARLGNVTLWMARAFRGQQHDPCPPDMLLRALAVGDYAIEPLQIARPKPDLDAFPHPTRLAGPGKSGNHQRRSKH